MSKPRDQNPSDKPFYKDSKYALYTLRKDGKITTFKVRHVATGQTKEFPVISNKVLKAFQEFENYCSKLFI